MTAFIKEFLTRIFVLGVLLCLIFAAASMGAVWSIKITVLYDWRLAAC